MCLCVCVWFAPAARGLRPSTLYPDLQDAHGVAAETQRRSCFQPLLGASRRGQQVGWGWEEWVIFCFSPGVGWALQTAFQTPSLRGPRGRPPPRWEALPAPPWSSLAPSASGPTREAGSGVHGQGARGSPVLNETEPDLLGPMSVLHRGPVGLLPPPRRPP